VLHREVDDFGRDGERAVDPGSIDGVLEGLADERAGCPIQMESDVPVGRSGLSCLAGRSGARDPRGGPGGSGGLGSRLDDRWGTSESGEGIGGLGARGGGARLSRSVGAGEEQVRNDMSKETEQEKPEDRNLMSHPDFLGSSRGFSGNRFQLAGA
jgi:hypothetical protein